MRLVTDASRHKRVIAGFWSNILDSVRDLMQPLVFGCQGSKLATGGLFSQLDSGPQVLIDNQ